MLWEGFVSIMDKTGLGDALLKATGHRKYGLKYEDLYIETMDVQEALSRLPKEVLSDRDDRLKVALVLTASKKVLPDDQWLKPEEDRVYLAPYLDQVVKERLMRENYRN